MPARASAANQAPLRCQLAVAEWSRSVVIVPHPPLRAGLSLRLRGAQHIGGSPGMPYPTPTRLSVLSDKYLGDCGCCFHPGADADKPRGRCCGFASLSSELPLSLAQCPGGVLTG